MTDRPSPATRLRALLAEPGIRVMPCCFDPLSARLIETAGFPLSFMSGFAASAVRLGLPDTGLMSYGEVVDQGRNICASVDMPIIGDGDTGYGNAVNVRRTVQGFAQAGFACVMIEDQLSPKRCGHTRGKQTVSRDEACTRLRAACEARDEGADILVMARTDARATEGLDEALARARDFTAIGADLLFVEAPRDADEMRRVCDEAPGVHMANLVEDGDTPLLSPPELEAIGDCIVAYPLTLLSASIRAMQESLTDMAAGHHPRERLLPFADLRRVVGFEEYYALEERYASPPREQR